MNKNRQLIEELISPGDGDAQDTIHDTRYMKTNKWRQTLENFKKVQAVKENRVTVQVRSASYHDGIIAMMNSDLKKATCG